MIDSKIEALIFKLKEKTESNQIEWESYFASSKRRTILPDKTEVIIKNLFCWSSKDNYCELKLIRNKMDVLNMSYYERLNPREYNLILNLFDKATGYTLLMDLLDYLK